MCRETFHRVLGEDSCARCGEGKDRSGSAGAKRGQPTEAEPINYLVNLTKIMALPGG